MKKTILLFLFTFFCFYVFSQDTIIKNNNDTIITLETTHFDKGYSRGYSEGYRLIAEISRGYIIFEEHAYSLAITNGYQANKYFFYGFKTSSKKCK